MLCLLYCVLPLLFAEAAVLPHIREQYLNDLSKSISPRSGIQTDIPSSTTDSDVVSKHHKTSGNYPTMTLTNSRSLYSEELQDGIRENIITEKLNISDKRIYHITGSNGKHNRQAVEYLWRFGYLTEDVSTYNRGTLARALRNFQARSNIAVTGRIDDATVAMMKKPRCGNKDGDGTDSLSRRQKRFRVKYNTDRSLVRWKYRYMYYKVTSYTDDMTKKAVDEEMRLAFERWSNVTSLVFEHTTCDYIDINIYFGKREHGKCPYAFDGPNGILAHAYGPGHCTVCGQLHFDDDEKWSNEFYTSDLTWNIANAATHEIGHVLGLSHSKIWGAMMYPEYRTGRNLSLHQDDIDAVQLLYGNKTIVYDQNATNDQPLTPQCIKGYTKPSTTTVWSAATIVHSTIPTFAYACLFTSFCFLYFLGSLHKLKLG